MIIFLAIIGVILILGSFNTDYDKTSRALFIMTGLVLIIVPFCLKM